MSILRVSAALTLLLCCAAAIAAEPQSRIVSAGSTAQIRIQRLSASGDAISDTGWIDGNVADLPAASGASRCRILVRDIAGNVTQNETSLTANDGHSAITLLAHDGKNGAIADTAGDLSFRFGDFLNFKDSERMRLTPSGDLYIHGLIHADQGIGFTDGSVVLPPVSTSSNQGTGVVEPPPRRARLLGLRPRPNAAGYQFVVDSVGVHIGTTSSYPMYVAGEIHALSDFGVAGNVALPASTAANAPNCGGAGCPMITTGVVSVDGAPFLNDFSSPTNTLLGSNAGNGLAGQQTAGPGVDGTNNTAIGFSALGAGYSNVAVGSGALAGHTAQQNIAVGYGAGDSGSGLTVVGGNIGIGSSLEIAASVLVGFNAGANSDGLQNIMIGAPGFPSDAFSIRIGNPAVIQKTFIARIRGVTTGSADAVPVVIDSNNQLGTISSSRRFKFDVEKMHDATDDLMRLRPVTFRYRAYGDDGPVQYGLIAEEVAEVYPEMVTHDQDGRPDAIMYQFLEPMLLVEVQKQHRDTQEIQRAVERVKAALAEVAQRVERLEKEKN